MAHETEQDGEDRADVEVPLGDPAKAVTPHDPHVAASDGAAADTGDGGWRAVKEGVEMRALGGAGGGGAGGEILVDDLINEIGWGR